MLLSKTHTERREILTKLLLNRPSNSQGSSLTMIEEKKVETATELSNYFEQCIVDGFEGIVVKKPAATYQPGTRNFNWIKLKRKNSGSLQDTLDSVIIGYYHGQGKRARFGIGAFLVAIYNQKEQVFQTIAKIGTGLTDVEWISLKELCDKHLIDHQLPIVDCPSGLKPDAWITPTIVCSIRTDEITRSPLHTAGKTDNSQGYALRFPRIMAYRPDKSATDTTTITEVDSLYSQQKQKNNKLLGI